jgi:hypothetical protein
LKSTVNSYKMDFVLYDGWLHRGFFSHNLRAFSDPGGSNFRGLGIKGYSDIREYGKWWTGRLWRS